MRWLRKGLYRNIASLLLVGLAVPLAAIAADFWAKKPYHEWSADETHRILEESPWATTLTLGGIQAVVTTGDSNLAANRGEMETDPTITYTLQFRSARPIREAQVRSSQLSSHYDKMSAQQKAAFDSNADKFLAVTFPDRVVVSVTFHANVQNNESLLRNYWASQSVPKLSQTVYLNTNAEKLSLTSYSFKDDTFQFTFPRPKQLRPDDRVSVEFVHPKINVISQQRILQEFKLKKMLVNGEPAF